MSWTSTLAHVLERSKLRGADLLEPHLDALAAGGTAGVALPADPELAREWRASLLRGELLTILNLRARAAAVTVVVVGDDGDDGVAIVDAGAPLLIAGAEASVCTDAIADALRERELVLAGPASSLWRLGRALRERGWAGAAAAVVVTTPPVMPAAAAALRELFGVEVGEALRDPDGGVLAIARDHGAPLEQLRPADQLVTLSREGDRLASGQPGVLARLRDGSARGLDVYGRLHAGAEREGRPTISLDVPATPIGDIKAPDLHQRLAKLPVFDWQLRLRATTELEISLAPGRDDAPTRAEVTAAVGIPREQLEVRFAEPASEFGSARVVDARDPADSQVTVVWAGEPGSSSRRAAWIEALHLLGGRGGAVRLLDARTGEALAGEGGELAGEADEPGRIVYVGDPHDDRERSLDPAPEGWISLLPGDDEREPTLIAATDRRRVALVQAVFEGGDARGLTELGELWINGIELLPYSRPMLGRGRESRDEQRTLWVDDARCVGAGDCQRICPTNAIELRGEPARPVIDEAACITCQLCVERCESLALRPLMYPDMAVGPETMVREAQQIREARRRARPVALHDLVRRPPAVVRRKPTVVLGLATVTLMEHAAAVLVDGQLVAAIEEERLARVRHYAWDHPDRPGTAPGEDPCIRIEQPWPRRSIDAVLQLAGLTRDDVDLIAVNGIPARMHRSVNTGRPPAILRANSVVFAPHHMTHAACVYGLSDFDDAWILSIDGRGDYETAAVWRAEGHAIELVDAVPWKPDRSFGGVYETITRILGFGGHGQGSTMALAALGEPSVDLRACMSIGDDHRPILSEWAAEKLGDRFSRGHRDPITDDHRNLAASLQHALETTVADYLGHHAGDVRGSRLALCGGVALNCRMNGILRDRFAPSDMYVPPGANDAGTAIGAAMLGHRELTGELPRLDLGHTHLGPQWTDDAIAKALERMRVPFVRIRDVGDQTAQLLEQGKIVCWFQGRMEFGPRALGGRSILADPRREDLKARLNHIKSRESWRPFGPSILAGRQAEWFMQDWDSRFMLFAVDVRPNQRDRIPVVVHADGSTRTQVVHQHHHPRYHQTIAAFERRTGVPMVVNTSFNRGGEPIVCTPVEAMRSFVGLGADAIVLGDCLVRRELMRRGR